MKVIEVSGRINEAGKLEIELPEGLPPGSVRVRIELGEDIPPLSEHEIDELLRTTPLTGAEIVAAGLTGGWSDLDIRDSAAWVEDMRRQRKEKRSSW